MPFPPPDMPLPLFTWSPSSQLKLCSFQNLLQLPAQVKFCGLPCKHPMLHKAAITTVLKYVCRWLWGLCSGLSRMPDMMGTQQIPDHRAMAWEQPKWTTEVARKADWGEGLGGLSPESNISPTCLLLSWSSQMVGLGLAEKLPGET